MPSHDFGVLLGIMKVINKRTPKLTKLHKKKCVICNELFGTYRITVKTCSNECKRKSAGINLRRGEHVDCVTCGKTMWVRPSENRRGSNRSFCSIECRYPNKKLDLQRGEYYSHDGYIVVSTTNDGRKQIKKHRLIMEKHIGRLLKPTEVVHHINEDKLDNRLENLQIMSVTEHNQHHARNGQGVSSDKASQAESTASS